MPPDPPPPLPTLAQFVISTKIIRVTFDRPLVPGIFLDFNWFARFGDRERTPGIVRVFAATPTVCTITTVIAPADLGPNIVQYTAALPDLIGQNGTAVAPFTEPLIAL